MPSAKAPISTCTAPSAASGEGSVSMRRRIQRLPSAMPNMNAASISSNECVDAPRTSDSRRIQMIS